MTSYEIIKVKKRAKDVKLGNAYISGDQKTKVIKSTKKRVCHKSQGRREF